MVYLALCSVVLSIVECIQGSNVFTNLLLGIIAHLYVAFRAVDGKYSVPIRTVS
jgi:hypothetical protein